jgi:hypothetical protein
MKQVDQSSKTPAAASSRRKWVAPHVDRLKAGDAENSLDPIVPDGALSFGS